MIILSSKLKIPTTNYLNYNVIDMARKSIKFFPLTDELRELLKTIKNVSKDYPHQSLVEVTLRSGQYHPADKIWLNNVREYYIKNILKRY